ncbi:MAG: TGS domain-containing protein [Ignavibacteria bacterium]|nr:TGS domain-containing protein [Ignavibacteria bacterium]
MPTNLPPEYFHIEKEYRSAKTVAEKIRHLEAMLSVIPKHKGTDKLRADLRSRLGKHKTEAIAAKKAGKHESQFIINHEGADARIVITGYSNTGKSSLLKAVTHARPEIAETPFTTWEPMPGDHVYCDIHFQVIDMPALDRDFLEPGYFDLLKSADFIVVLADITADPFEQLAGAIQILRLHGISAGGLERGDETGKYEIPLIAVVNKVDGQKEEDDYLTFSSLIPQHWRLLPVSVNTGRNVEDIFSTAVEMLHLIRVYSKQPGKSADIKKPFILRAGATVDDFALQVHKDFHEKLKHSRIWGYGVFDGQVTGRDHILHDGDIVELHL